jgi:hypothetical protein
MPGSEQASNHATLRQARLSLRSASESLDTPGALGTLGRVWLSTGPGVCLQIFAESRC